MSDIEDFKARRLALIKELSDRSDLQQCAIEFLGAAGKAGYAYFFDWLGLPIIQIPQDIVAVQEVIWRVKPEAIVETGVARGGSLALSASMLQLIGANGLVIGVDIDIRRQNREAIEQHPLANRIKLIEGSSTSPTTFQKVVTAIGSLRPVVVLLDSSHTYEHVLAELQLYSPLVDAGSYIIVFDTAIDQMPPGYCGDRPWGPGNNPRTAVRAFLQETDRFEIDRHMAQKLLLTSNPDGYLRCLRAP